MWNTVYEPCAYLRDSRVPRKIQSIHWFGVDRDRDEYLLIIVNKSWWLSLKLHFDDVELMTLNVSSLAFTEMDNKGYRKGVLPMSEISQGIVSLFK